MRRKRHGRPGSRLAIPWFKELEIFCCLLHMHNSTDTAIYKHSNK
jgi:hypothetical protein